LAAEPDLPYMYVPYTNQECGTRNPSLLHPSRLLLHLSSPGLGAAWKNLRTDHLTQPKHASKPALQVNRRLWRKCNGTQVQGRPRAQSRPGARGQHNHAALPCEYERTSACLAVVAAALARRRSTTPRIISSEGAKRVAQARGTQDASWGS
jgi:hypothetical protein